MLVPAVETSIQSLAKLVISVTGSQANVVPNAQDSGGISRLCADLTLAGQKLNYGPSISLEQGLRLSLQRDVRSRTRKPGNDPCLPAADMKPGPPLPRDFYDPFHAAGSS